MKTRVWEGLVISELEILFLFGYVENFGCILFHTEVSVSLCVYHVSLKYKAKTKFLISFLKMWYNILPLILISLSHRRKIFIAQVDDVKKKKQKKNNWESIINQRYILVLGFNLSQYNIIHKRRFSQKTTTGFSLFCFSFFPFLWATYPLGEMLAGNEIILRQFRGCTKGPKSTSDGGKQAPYNGWVWFHPLCRLLLCTSCIVLNANAVPAFLYYLDKRNPNEIFLMSFHSNSCLGRTLR